MGEQPARNWRLYDSGFVTQEVQHNKMDRYETAEDASVQTKPLSRKPGSLNVEKHSAPDRQG